jgi:hypothetical protein
MALCEALTERPYSILHVVAHGRVVQAEREPVIYLEGDDHPGVDPVTATRLVGRLQALGGLYGVPHFAFLSCCESAKPAEEGALGGLGERLVRDLGMPAVLAMTDRVTVRTALALSKAFYERLRGHGLADLALTQAYAGLAERPDVAVPVPAPFCRDVGRPLFGAGVATDALLANS